MTSPSLPDLTGSLGESKISEGPTSLTNSAPGAGTSEANQAHPGPSLLSSAQCQGVLLLLCMRDTVEPSVHGLRMLLLSVFPLTGSLLLLRFIF